MENLYPFLEYGALAIFILLAFGIVGIPVPDETIIFIAGVLVAKGKFSLLTMLLAVYGGAFTGITISYILGSTCGHYLIEKFGYLIRITPKKIEQTKKWFEEIGKWALFFGYFIIGLRHLSAFVAGMVKLRFKQFALFAYSGLLIWVATLFTLGYTLGYSWQRELNVIRYVGIFVAIAALIAIYGFFYYKHKSLSKK